MLAVLITALLIVPSTSTLPVVRKGDPLPLADAVESSTLVCVGTVDQVVRIPCPDGWERTWLGAPPRELTFGRIRVERVLHGDASIEFAWHETWRTWACDTTASLEGRRALFFLRSADTDRQNDVARAVVAGHLGPGLVLRNLGSGDGLRPIEVVDDGTECVRYGGAPAALDLPLPGPFPSRPNARRIGTQSLEAISAWIEELSRFPSDSCAIRMQSDGLVEPRGQPFDARFLADGSYRIAIDERRHQRVRSGRIEEPAWSELRAAIERACTDAAPLASASAALGRRNLTVRLGGSERRWSLPAAVADSSERPTESRSAHEALLSAWALVRGALDCLECADHRSADERARSR